jgi:hypothetical protein
LQITPPIGQLHAPDTQLAPTAQTFAQLPQWFGSVDTSEHEVPQLTRPVAHIHAPAAQVALLGHARPHAPQFVVSVRVSTQR